MPWRAKILMQCIIPCAGGSSRMAGVPKQLLLVKGKPVLSHVIDFWKDKVDSYIFIIRRKASWLLDYFPDNSAVVFQDEPKGLADAILKAEPYVRDRCVIALGDCLNFGYFDFWEPAHSNYRLGVGVWNTSIDKSNEYEIKKSYLVRLAEGAVSDLIEKPKETDGYCGMGTYFMDRRVFEYIRKALPMLKPGGGDFTYVLQYMVEEGEELWPYFFRGNYINVTSPQDLVTADGLDEH